jgi:hypothetical protein
MRLATKAEFCNIPKYLCWMRPGTDVRKVIAIAAIHSTSVND